MAWDFVRCQQLLRLYIPQRGFLSKYVDPVGTSKPESRIKLGPQSLDQQSELVASIRGILNWTEAPAREATRWASTGSVSWLDTISPDFRLEITPDGPDTGCSKCMVVRVEENEYLGNKTKTPKLWARKRAPRGENSNKPLRTLKESPKWKAADISTAKAGQPT